MATGVFFWGMQSLELVAAWVSPEEYEQMVQQDVAEAQRQARFYGLTEQMSDLEYFAELEGEPCEPVQPLDEAAERRAGRRCKAHARHAAEVGAAGEGEAARARVYDAQDARNPLVLLRHGAAQGYVGGNLIRRVVWVLRRRQRGADAAAFTCASGSGAEKKLVVDVEKSSLH